MPTDIPLACSCGKVRGVVQKAAPARTNRMTCCCGDCQNYARTLGRETEMLDDIGGTDVFQASPASLSFTAGQEKVGCLRLTPKGALRWYATCCNSPIANTLSSQSIPFMAVHRPFVDSAALEAPLAEVVGPIRATINARLPPALAKERRSTKGALLAMLPRVAKLTATWILKGDHKRSLFFDAKGTPIVEATTTPKGTP